MMDIDEMDVDTVISGRKAIVKEPGSSNVLEGDQLRFEAEVSMAWSNRD
jgi:hypothetical protein